ncbi:arylsulfatase [Xanthomarina sp. GH4-25]|uniref:arylsulfatase n=1 Tax=Xanthomarina sp. GH4-25 TaxID=3349335 RepID=UPI003877ADB8
MKKLISKYLRNSLCLIIMTSILTVGLSTSIFAQDKPNVVYILVDNTGWGDFSVYGGTTPTPNIDKLASQGMRFNNYNVEAQCTPTRSAIMTGRHPVRSGTYKVPFPGEGKDGMSPWEYTIAELLSDGGYKTALYGKWHLGHDQSRLPNTQGFDEWWGYPNSADESAYSSYPMFNLMVEEVKAKNNGKLPMDLPPHILTGKKGELSTQVMPFDLEVRPIIDQKYNVPKTIEFIKKNANTRDPFFVYLAYSEVHPPMIANPEFAGKSSNRGGVYSDVIAEMDVRVGEVVAAVKAAGIADNTIIILASDNATGGLYGAGGNGGSNGPWRGDFFNTPFEGSMRVPCIVSWPEKIPAGTVNDEIFAAVDWLPTLAGLTGLTANVPTDRPIDGVDASAFLLGKSKTTGRTSYMFFGADGNLMSVKWRYYKTVFRYSEGISSPYVEPQLPLMYDLSSDPGEKFNLWESTLTNGWVFAPTLEVIGNYKRSLAKYPNIKVGEDFKGY